MDDAHGILPDCETQLKEREAEVERLRQESLSKDEFIRITNHELRTPLDVIRGNLDMVLKGDAGVISDEAHAFLSDALLGADRLTKLVNDMLDISRIESRRMQFTLAEVDLVTLLATVAKEFETLAREKGISVETEFMGDIPSVFSDEERLYQIVDNLIGNALKFTSRGGLITLSATRENDLVRVSVRDTGIGIRAEDQRKLFKRFPQIDTTLVAAPKGTGLGLSLVWQIVEALGGEITAHSDGLGKGATFSFTIPVAGTKRAEDLSRFHHVFLNPDSSPVDVS